MLTNNINLWMHCEWTLTFQIIFAKVRRKDFLITYTRNGPDLQQIRCSYMAESIKGLQYCEEHVKCIPFPQSNLDMRKHVPALVQKQKEPCCLICITNFS